MRKHYQIDATLTLQGPILTKGGQTVGPGIDAPVARDAQGRVYLPYSLVKGKVREALADLGCAEMADWLGKGSDDGDGLFGPHRGRLRFADFVTDQTGRSGPAPGVIRRIEIDQGTGSASRAMLAMIEAPFGYGEEVAFRGRIEVIAEEGEGEEVRRRLDQALAWVPSYGAHRSVGFGRTLKVETQLVEQRPSAVGSPREGPVLPVRWRLDRPFCVVGRKHAGNHFQSLGSIPGAVLKGAIARLILECDGSSDRFVDSARTSAHFPSLCRHFEKVRFTEARPMREGATARPVEPPLSVVTSPLGREPWYDVALLEGPCLIAGAAPAFAPDWKGSDETAIRAAFGWPSLPRERRTRTAIDGDRGRARDEQLFSYSLVLPSQRVGDVEQSFVWESVIGLEQLPETERAVVRDELRDLLAHGLPNIGKTRAVGHVEWRAATTPPAVGTCPPGPDLCVATLQTECLMTDPTTLQSEGLSTAYEAFWSEVSGGSLELVRSFARQELHGGFLARRSLQQRYEPFLVTERGSVFVLRVLNPAEAGKRLAAWTELGLPRPGWVATRYGQPSLPLWRTCPFLAEVGFGEVMFDLDCHLRKKPNPE